MRYRIVGMNGNAIRRWALILSFSGSLLCVRGASAQTNDKNLAERQSSPHVKVTSNLVVVRVVVRDAQGKPVEGLQKEDFKLFDQGKEQAIAQFEAGSSNAPTNNAFEVPNAKQPEASPQPPSSPSLPGKFIALYFDDLNTSESDLVYARDAVDHYLATNFQPQDRVAIFTPQKMVSDFTSDPKQIHDSLSTIHANLRALGVASINCPNLSDYQALQITGNPVNQDSDAWKVALSEAARCGVSGGGGQDVSNRGSQSNVRAAPNSSDQQLATGLVLQVAWNITNQVEALARSDLQQIENVVKYISQMPGQRSVVLISSGFLSQGDQVYLDRIIDHALRSQVVINSLNPKGLAVMLRESDASQNDVPVAGNISSTVRRLDSTRELLATHVLTEVADGTGGEYFHDNNDLSAGLGKLAGSPPYYVLAFTPRDMRTNGKFHALTVKLAEEHKGYSIQARRGYFVPANAAVAEAEAKKQEVADSEAQLQEQVRETTYSKSDVEQFPTELTVRISEGHNGKRDLSLSSHVDTAPLHFRKEGGHNFNTLTFSIAVFDQKGTLLESQERQAKIDVPDQQLPNFFKIGFDANLTLHLKPGNYRVREVVADSEEHHMTALSREIEIPPIEKASLPWNPPDVDAPVGSISPTPACSLPDVLQLAARRSEAQVNDLQNFDAREQVHLELMDSVGMSEVSDVANFNYLVDFGKLSQEFKVREVRQPLAGTNAQHLSAFEDNGIPVLALIFYPLLRSDYDMRCEGFSRWNDQPAWIVYFHQIKEKRPRTAAIPTGTKVYPVSLKGRAWIDTETGQVLHLETNLVEGLAIFEQSNAIRRLKTNAVSVEYGPVKSKTQKGEVWLPRSAVTYTDFGNHRLIVEHTYSDFQLFYVQTQQTIEKPRQP
jgi:VWFA-related protein